MFKAVQLLTLKQEVRFVSKTQVLYLSVAEVNLRESLKDLTELFGQGFAEGHALAGWHDDIKLTLLHINGNVNLEDTPATKHTACTQSSGQSFHPCGTNSPWEHRLPCGPISISKFQ